MIRWSLASPWRTWRLALCAVVVCACLGAPAPVRADGGSGEHVVVKLQPGVNAETFATAQNSTVLRSVEGTNVYSLAVPSGSNAADFVLQLGDYAEVSYAECDLDVSHPEMRGAPIHLPFEVSIDPGNYLCLPAINLVDGLVGPTLSLNPITVAVLDTGLDMDHKVFRNRTVPGYNALSPLSSPEDVADGLGNNAVGHGTMVAGLILALAPNAQVMPIRVLNGDGVGTVLDLVEGIRFAVSHGARVINLSLGTTQRCSVLREAVKDAQEAGVMIVAAAGNDGVDHLLYPAAMEEVLAVGSVDQNLKKSAYSNYGHGLAVLAPGTDVRSTYLADSYATWSGTSFATPLVAAEAALLFGLRPFAEEEAVRQVIVKTARSLDRANPNYRGKLGRGLIDVQRALRMLDGDDRDEGDDH